MCLGSAATQRTSDATPVVQVRVVDISATLEKGDFTTVDQTVKQNLHSKVWFSQKASEDLHASIAVKAGHNNPENQQVSFKIQCCCCTIAISLPVFALQIEKVQIPRDFILDKKNYTQNQLDQRFEIGGRRLFDIVPKRYKIDSKGEQVEILRPLPSSKNDREDFTLRCNNVRDGWVNMWHARVHYLWIDGIHREVPELKEEVKSFNDYIKWYQTRDLSGTDAAHRRIRRIVFIVQTRVITKQMMMACEDDILAKTGIEYQDRLVNGSTCITNRQTGCCLTIGQRVKQSKTNQPIRATGFKFHNEVQCGREKKIDSKTGLPVNCMAGVVACLKITAAVWGSDGWLGVNPYHFSQVEKAKEQPKIKLPSGGQEREGFRAFLLQQVQNECSAKDDILAFISQWDSQQAKNAPEVTVCSGASTVSPLTTVDASVISVSCAAMSFCLL